MDGREAERLEEDEVMQNLPIYIDPKGMLPRELQHLAQAIDRLKSRNAIALLPNGGGHRWTTAAQG